jgi:hypothetical protein
VACSEFAGTTGTSTQRQSLCTICRVSRLGKAPIPYEELLAYQDWAPYIYLDGYWGDPSATGTTNKRAQLIQEGDSKVLEVLLPQGCLTNKCAMQVKSALVLPTDSATLKFKCALGTARIHHHNSVCLTQAVQT